VRLRAAGATNQQIRDLKGYGRKHDQTVIITAAQPPGEAAVPKGPNCCGCGCGEAVGGRRCYVDQAHRKRAQRHRAAQSRNR
jgi:hypothetical protein